VTTRAAPYPAETRAKGWRFELDQERIRQSDTWALTPADLRPWLLMLWMTAWEQTPCGSLPADDALIAARIGMAPRLFSKHRGVLLRAWWLAEDGRLYHDTLTERVQEMMERRRKESDRKALARAKTGAIVPPTRAAVPRDNDGTHAGVHPPSDTGTRTGTSTGEEDEGADAPPSSAGAPEIRPEVQICIALRQAGIGDTNASHPLLSALVEAGATVGEFLGMAAKAEGKGNGFAHVLAAVRGERERAKATGGEIHNGPLRIVDRVALTVPQSPGSVAAAAAREAEERAHAEQVAAVTPARRAEIIARLADSMSRMGVRA